ncbi:transcript variant X1 [Nothobranchius furzeri]|uniref:Transcript variant X1 n=1 Tax=Nothobranchius furzeri TaxID=105023 RepID=A0A9D2YZ85_NOTFU|nr:transcript variant X1 [Nothobranchius furzeri]
MAMKQQVGSLSAGIKLTHSGTLKSCFVSPLVFVSVSPRQLQFFKYDHFCVSCEGEKDMDGWRVIQRRRDGKVCSEPVSSLILSGFMVSVFVIYISPQVHQHMTPLCVSAAFPETHSGTYWCETGLGANSSDIIINITTGSVILESPAVPVTEGDSATLICRSKSPGMTEFYKNDVLINNGIEGSMTLLDVSVSDQGRYRCKVRRSGESPESWLTVRALSPPHQEQSAPLLSVFTLVRLLIVGAPYLLSTIILGLIYQDRRSERRALQASWARGARRKVTMQIIT